MNNPNQALPDVVGKVAQSAALRESRKGGLNRVAIKRDIARKDGIGQRQIAAKIPGGGIAQIEEPLLGEINHQLVGGAGLACGHGRIADGWQRL